MEKRDLISLYQTHPNIERIRAFLHEDQSKTLHLNGLLASSSPLLFAALEEDQKNTRLIMLNEREEAAYFFNDLTNLLGSQYVYYFPSSYKRSIRMQQLDKDNVMLRTEVLNRMASRNRKALVITYPEAILERVVSKKALSDHTLILKKGEEVNLDFITEMLYEYGFERNDFVYEPGQFSVRGGIIDVFSYSAEHPYRINFLGDQVDSIRSFEIETQLSIRKHASISIVPNLNERLDQVAVQTIFDFLPDGSQLWTKDLSFCLNRLEQILKGIDVSASSALQSLTEASTREDDEILDPVTFRKKLVDPEEIQKKLTEIQLIEFGQKHFFPSVKSFFFNTSMQPPFNKNFDLLKEKLIENQSDLYRNIILSDSAKQLKRLEAILNPDETIREVKVDKIEIALHEGFYDHDLRFACFTDHQVFERYHRFKLRRSYSKKEALSIKELTDLHPGDFVVHVDHGIGQFGGLEKVDINGKRQEAIKLVYKDQDTLYVSIHSLHRISKYKGKDGEGPKVHKLGSGAWQKLKQKTKSRIKDIAKELIALYAKRKAQEGFAFSSDTYLQHELEASFLYEDTPDQLKSTQAVKEDMESKTPMDRLVCGDVGFGKTEVAMRASFKAVADSKQVAVLVPTTILALQHYKTFLARFKNFPANVEYISRLRSTKNQNRVLKELEEGKIDVIIGTHKLISKSIKFKDLGLLIIDEEQKFGVAMKEKLRHIKINIDTLALSATPIPRTLQFSMMGARDLSIINTPPPNRHPIITELVTLNEELIKEVIEYELDRDGQVFFIHNRVQNIGELEGLINRLLPKARTIVAHGQMEGRLLENRMLSFINGDHDILIATSIVENGLDIPNANTIIINNAHHFGLSDLHQLRGRVGRSNKKAFCYLIAPPLHLLAQDSRRRLKAIHEFAELGSGFNIAMQDLDIRGAGNILGAEQSGFVADIGFETYQKILNEAMREMREVRESGVGNRESGDGNRESGVVATGDVGTWGRGDQSLFVHDTSIDSDLAVLFPESYIESTSERIRLYRELDEISDEDALQIYTEHLQDRFGELPVQTEELLDMIRLRWLAMRLGVERIMMKNQRMVMYFIANQESAFFNSPIFVQILNFVQTHPRHCQMREKNGKLTLSFEKVASVRVGLEKLGKVLG
ncbi:MAG: transcription-repair coupling factor [Bacteroidetes bacterium]|nr:transcription-repair coupling factor [Bacteroidota bacterium]